MIQGEQRGFTIIETMLFLGVSAMLLIIAFSFTASTLRSARFTDATKSLQSFFQEQYTRVQTNSLSLNTPSGKTAVCDPTTGLVTSQNLASNTGSSKTCMLLGVALDLASDGKSIAVYPVLGSTQATDQTLSKVNPQIWSDAVETYTLGWQAVLSTNSAAAATAVLAKNVAAGLATKTASVNRLLFLRNVESEAINFYSTTQVATIASIINEEPQSNTRNVPTLVCIKSDDGGNLRGAVQIKGTGVETSININAITSTVVGQTALLFGGLITPSFGGISCGV